jgi:NADPH2:quinone reductase
MFVNPLTALAMVQTLQLDGVEACIHTAAASQLGQILVKICAEDGLPLLNVVRRPEQADLMRDLGAEYVCDSGQFTFREGLRAAIAATRANVAFDAIVGGAMAGELLSAIEAAAIARNPHPNPFGSFERKQVYVYGHLDTSPTLLHQRDFGLVGCQRMVDAQHPWPHRSPTVRGAAGAESFRSSTPPFARTTPHESRSPKRCTETP